MRKTKLIIAGAIIVYVTYLVGHYFDDEPRSSPVAGKMKALEKQELASAVLPLPRLLEVARPAKVVVMPVPTNSAIKAQPNEVSPPSEFSLLIERAWKRLPRMAEIKKKGRTDFHHTPSEVIDVADELGAIADAMDGDVKLVPVGAEFLRKCALATDVMTAARAVCLRDLKHYARATTLDLSVFPDSVKRVADALPQIP